MPISSALLYCRPGFENECAAEFQLHAQKHGVPGFCKAKNGQGWVIFEPHAADQIPILQTKIRFLKLVFARQLIWTTRLIKDLPDQDRVTPLLSKMSEELGSYLLERGFQDLWAETADTNEAKELQNFVRKFSVPMRAAMKKAGYRQDEHAPRVHLFFLGAQACYLGVSEPSNSSPFYMGIPRLRFPSAAPSRSTLKLEEAFKALLNPQELDQKLKSGMSAVDLGAAPGGWTYQFVARQIHVTAVDNGPMSPSLLETGLVTHLKADGFKYRPKKPVDWMVCDMVEQPFRVASLVADWAKEGLANHMIFNLKLPMKKRLDEVNRCLEILRNEAQAKSLNLTLRCKQLYHDREEVTVYLGRE